MRKISFEQEQQERQRVCEIALTWQRTPYKANQRVKGPYGGVDCLTFIVGTLEEAGLIPHQNLPHYSATWHLHQYEEKYLDAIKGFCREVGHPFPGDLAVYKIGKCFSHAAIVLDWPCKIIHAFFGRNVLLTDARNDGDLKGKPVTFWSFWTEGTPERTEQPAPAGVNLL